MAKIMRTRLLPAVLSAAFLLMPVIMQVQKAFAADQVTGCSPSPSPSPSPYPSYSPPPTSPGVEQQTNAVAPNPGPTFNASYTPCPTPTPTPPTDGGTSGNSINGLAGQRFNQMITNQVLGSVLLGVNEKVNRSEE